MPAANRLKLHIESDGTISVDSDDFSEELHLSAEKFLGEVFEALGGERKVIEEKRDRAHSHLHGVDKLHTDGKQHSHG
jgi:hypothetical protein